MWLMLYASINSRPQRGHSSGSVYYILCMLNYGCISFMDWGLWCFRLQCKRQYILWVISERRRHKQTPRKKKKREKSSLSAFLLLEKPKDSSIDLILWVMWGFFCSCKGFGRNQVHLEGRHELFIKLTAVQANILFIPLHHRNHI